MVRNIEVTKSETGMDDPKESMRAAAVAIHEAKRAENELAPSPADAVETDENGIPVERLRSTPVPKLCGPQPGGTIVWPLWTGKLQKTQDGLQPNIVLVPINAVFNDGRGTKYYKEKKGWKEIREIPDTYAAIRDRYLADMREYESKQRRADEIKQLLKEAGVAIPGMNATTTKTAGL